MHTKQKYHCHKQVPKWNFISTFIVKAPDIRYRGGCQQRTEHHTTFTHIDVHRETQKNSKETKKLLKGGTRTSVDRRNDVCTKITRLSCRVRKEFREFLRSSAMEAESAKTEGNDLPPSHFKAPRKMTLKNASCDRLLKTTNRRKRKKAGALPPLDPWPAAQTGLACTAYLQPQPIRGCCTATQHLRMLPWKALFLSPWPPPRAPSYPRSASRQADYYLRSCWWCRLVVKKKNARFAKRRRYEEEAGRGG